MTKGFGKADYMFLGALSFLLLVWTAWVYGFGKEEGDFVIITKDGKRYGTYSLKKEQEIEVVTGKKTTNTIWISGGQADMRSADCPDRRCVHQKAISAQGETIVCLPNKVVVEIIGKERADLDAVT